MTHRIMAEIDGAVVPIEDCDWVFAYGCGCPYGVMTPLGITDEDAAWREFQPDRRKRDRARRGGDTAELMTHTRYVADVSPRMSLYYQCPHGPSTDGPIPLELGGEAVVDA